MSHDFKLTEKALRELKMLTESKAWQDIRQAEHVRGLRGEVTANWLDNFMNRMNRLESEKGETSKTSHLINAETGRPHTVESMVEELRKRVKLDTLTKSGENEIPLSKKMAKQLEEASMANITLAIENFLSSHRGHADDQAILYYLRDTFGEEEINKISDKITAKITELKKDFAEPLLYDNSLAESALGQPLKLDESFNNDELFSNIKDGLNRK